MRIAFPVPWPNMRHHFLIAVALALAGLSVPARAQMYPSITELGRTADLVAFATVVQASDTTPE